MPSKLDYDWLRQAAAAEATDVALPRVIPGSPPRPDLNKVPAGFAALGEPQATAAGLDPQAKLLAALKALDLLPSLAGGTADVMTPGVARATGASGLAAAAMEPVRELGYRALGQQHLVPGDWRDMLLRAGQAGLGQAVATPVGRAVSVPQLLIGRAPEDFAAAAYGGLPRKLARPGIIKTALEENIVPERPLLFEGTAKAQAALNASHAAEDAIASGSKATAFKSSFAHAAEAKVLDKLGKGATAADRAELRALADATRSEEFRPGPNGMRIEKPLTTEEVLGFKRTYDAKQNQTWSRVEGGQPIAASPIEKQYQIALAGEARNWLRNNVHGLGRQMQKTSELIALKPAVQWAESQPIVGSREGVFATARDLALTRERMGNAALASQPYARTLGNRGAVKFASQIPRMVGGKLITPPLEGEKAKK
jgi:hypothetical protein